MWRVFKDFFIPHSGNNYRPNFLERMSVGIMLVLILLSFAMANLQALLWISSDWLVSTILPSVIVDLTNEQREEGGLNDIVRNPILDRAATMKAEHMAKNEYFDHYSPEGVSPWYWFDQAGYNYWNAGENLAVHFTESNEVVDAWMNSPSHRANIMNGSYTEIGVGTAKGEYKGHKTIYVVQLFGTPRKVAGASTVAADPVTIEKIAVQPEESDVAPATTETVRPETPASAPKMEPEPELITEPVITEVVFDSSSETAVIESDMATTAREGEPATTILNTDVNGGSELPFPLRSTTQSGMWLSFVYSILASVVVISLFASLIVEWRRHHPVQSIYAGGLLTVMALLLYIHLTLTSVVVIA